MRKIFAFLTLLLLLFSTTAGASDYKAWLPLLPDTLGGMPRSGEPEGVNMEMGGQKWSSLHQEYSTDSGDKSVGLTIVWGKGSPQLAAFQMMSGMKMETEDQIVKTVSVSRYKGLVTLEKKEKSGALMISLSETMLVVIEAEPITSEAELLKLAEQLPLAKFAGQAE